MLPARSAGWLGLGSRANISPRVQFLSLFPSLMHWLVSSYRGLRSCSDLSFNQNESWCWVLYVPRENSRGHLCAVVLGARAGGLSQEKRELWMLLRETSTATKTEAAPGFTTCTGTQGGGTGVDAICHSVQPRVPGPVSSKPLPYPFSGDRAAQGAAVSSICPW